jgi:myo-inositol-1(or 4)-monophosphatase
MPTLLNDLHIARKAAQAGARVVKEQFGLSQKARIKDGSQTLVTDTDLAAEAAILKVLKTYSNFSILSEESGLTEALKGPRWIVDPLDGTSNFARSLPLFSVSVALVDGARVLAGVIIDPVHQNEYYSQRGDGAFCNNRRLIAKKKNNPVSSLFLNHGHQPEDIQRFTMVTSRLAGGYNLRKLGTTALELCYVATGLFDGFVCSGDEIWDYAAGVLIATEAGFKFTDWQGRAWDGESNFLLVARPEIHGDIMDKIRNIR